MTELYPYAERMRVRRRITIDPKWEEAALCAEKIQNGELPSNTFIEGSIKSLEVAKPICEQCPVARECLAFGLQEERYSSGVYGGFLLDEGEVVGGYTNTIRRIFPGHFR